MYYSFLQCFPYFKRDPFFFALQIRFNVYLVLGVLVVVLSAHFLYFWGWGVFSLVILPVALLFGYGVRSC